MCGICGWVDWAGGAGQAEVERMCARLEHRGPDGQGVWRDPQGLAVLGHRRLRVLDISARADQPMLDPDGAVLVYNGEVYSFREIRTELEDEGRIFATSGDTEVVLAALNRWGSQALERFNGMFALALWDSHRQRLLLARDRIGIKPLFWAEVSGGIAFASELPALLLHPGVGKDVDTNCVASWLQTGYLSGRATLLRKVNKLPPGHVLEADAGGVKVRPWYELLENLALGDAPSAGAAAEQLEHLVRDAVRIRLVSDVPLGCFLSAGVDSTAVVAAAHAEGGRPETLTVRFADGEDESVHAARTAAFLGLEHRIVDCSPDEMLGLFERWTDVAGDPIADPSLAPTWLVSKAARKEWTVALSGDGGDELLSGYPRLRLMPRLAPLLAMPGSIRRAVGRALPPRRWAAKLDAALRTEDQWAAYEALQGVWPLADVKALTGVRQAPLPWPDDLLTKLQSHPPWRRYRLLDALTFLPERVLAKVDRASMDHSLEVRVPLLDHRIVEFVFALPPAMARKNLLRSLSARLGVPSPPRKKSGFEVPLANWLRGPLRQTIENDLFGPGVRNLGLDGALLRRTWQDHQSGRADFAERLFSVAVLARWVGRLVS